MKIGISGKGGVGKTTLTALLCWALKDAGVDVLAVDADPDTNLGRVLGFKDYENITPIVNMKELIKERMEVQEGGPSLFKLNPKIDDIPNKFIREHDGIKLIVMGTVKAGDAGCACPQNAFLRRLLHQVVLSQNEHIIVDFEAGIEHLGRGTASRFDHLVIVVEPTSLSLDSFSRIYPLAKDIGIKTISAVANRITAREDIDFINSYLGKIKMLGDISFSPACIKASQTGGWQVLKQDKIYQEVTEIAKSLLN